MRELNLLQALGSSMYPVAQEEGTDTFFKDKIVIGYSNDAETNALEWEMVSLSRRRLNWEEMQYDRETNQGKSFPFDMLWAWIVFPFSPVIKKGGSTLKGFQHFCSIHLKTQELPCVENLKRLKSKDSLQAGMWILIIRTPRPFAAKITVPLSRKKLERFASETEEEFLTRTQELKKRSESEKHPTEDQLYVTRNYTLLQGVAKNIVCTKCGAKGHHHERTHDDVYAPAPLQCTAENQRFLAIQCKPKFPAFMKVLAYPMEEIQLTKMLGDTNGFTLSIRETTTKVPLRLARKLLLDGLNIEGEIHASGVGKRKRILHDAEDELARANAESKRIKETEKKEETEFTFQPLQIDMSYEWDVDRRFYVENYIRMAREFGFKEEANKAAKNYLDSLDSKYWKPTYLLD
jgi:hypothetical protein